MLEALWIELSSEPEQVQIPLWHKDILDERLVAAMRGDIEVIDWDASMVLDPRYDSMKVRMEALAWDDLVEGYEFYEEED